MPLFIDFNPVLWRRVPLSVHAVMYVSVLNIRLNDQNPTVLESMTVVLSELDTVFSSVWIGTL
jgi:hypothetical protein